MNISKYLPIMTLAFSCTCCTNVKDNKELTQKEIIDTSVNPGTDFYKFACGGWIKNHPLSPEYSRYGTFNVLAENNEIQIREIIEDLSKKENKKGTVEQKIADLYNLALDTTRRNEDGAQPIRTALTQISTAQNKKDLLELTCQLSRKGVPALFNIYVDGDIKDSKNNIVTISQGGLTLGTRDYYLENDSTTQKIREAYKNYIQELFCLSGYSKEEAVANMNNVMKIETEIAKASYSKTKLRDVPNNYHKMSYEQLKKEYKNLDWDLIFQALHFPSFKTLTVSQPEPIHAVEKIFVEEDLETLKSYLNFHLMDAASSFLDDNFEVAAFNFYSKTLSGIEQQKPEWKKAVNTVNSALGMAVGKIYVQKYFPAEAKERMLTLVKNLQASLAERIEAQAWMDRSTKDKALDKLANFYIKIGYPNEWKDYSPLDIDKQFTYWKNIENVNEFEFDYQLNTKINKPTNKDEWLMTPQTINAYYNPNTNEICFPAGILQPPFFDMNADDATNYGAIGVVIGHEMTHGFDDQGSQFDKEGNLKNWWTKKDNENFQQRITVMKDFFDKIEVLPGLKANGALTLGENIADHGGLQVSFNAYKKATKDKKLETKDGFTPDQRFFLAYSFVWAQNIRKKEIEKRTKMDPHSLGEWRVNGALPHIDAWYEAFNITEKDSLFIPKAQRVDIW